MSSKVTNPKKVVEVAQRFTGELSKSESELDERSSNATEKNVTETFGGCTTNEVVNVTRRVAMSCMDTITDIMDVYEDDSEREEIADYFAMAIGARLRKSLNGNGSVRSLKILAKKLAEEIEQIEQ